MSLYAEMIPSANPAVILREEFDNWAILFDPDSNVTFGINPMGVYIWKRLDGMRTIGAILAMLKRELDDVPEGAETHLKEFIEDLVNRGLATYKNQ